MLIGLVYNTGLPTKVETVKTTETLRMWQSQVFGLKYSNFMAYIMIWQLERNKFTVAGSREYKETDSINFL